ncbi:MAG: hypothetical protein KAS01_00595 [Candidatus Pacebacteria bacterium]|nr:hypothetical protein [Candidatus Paceibacterota bacterium]
MNNKKIFYNYFLLFFVAVSFLGGFLFTNNQAEGYVYSNACRTSCNDSTFLPPCAAGCFYTDDYVDVGATIDKGACTVRQSSASGNPVECNPLTIYNASCNDGVTACSEDRCPNTGSENGAKCTVTVGNSADFSGSASCNIDAVTTKIGNWDDSQNKCVICSGLKESEICADTGSIRIDDITRVCDSGDSAGATFETACSGVVSALCDDKIEGAACTGGTCNATGQCVLSATCDTNPIIEITPSTQNGNLNEELSYTVKVTNNDNVTCSSRTFDITKKNSLPGSWTESFSSTSLNINGGSSRTTTYKITSGTNIVHTFAITATDSSDSTLKDSGVGTYEVIACPAGALISVNPNSGSIGDTITVSGTNNISDFTLCLYDGSGNLEDDKIGNAGSFESFTFIANSNGTWNGTIELGLFSCPGSPGACKRSCVISAAAGPPPPPPCTTNIICAPTSTCSGTPGSMTIDIECVDSGTCATPTTTTTNSCCNTSADCATGDACDTSTAYGTCIPCTGEGFPAASALLCCDGLNLIDDGAGTMICSAKCDPSASFFCNPLRQSVETLVQGGEKMIGYILGIIGSVALLLVIISGTMYMTSAGNEEKIASSKKILTGAIIGLAISLLSFSLLQLLISIL